MRLKPCNCSEGNHRRMPRTWWMRALPRTVRYRCASCGAHMLLRNQDHKVGMVRVLVMTLLVMMASVVTAIAVDLFQDTRDQLWRHSVERVE